MVNTTAFGKRIQEIMKFYHVSASGFADAMGVGRSSISHILSGRNKPSLDFVMKITEAYPEAELYWLLYGQGTFPKSEEIESPKELSTPIPTAIPSPISTSNVTESEQDLFSLPEPEVQNDISDIVDINKEKQIIHNVASNKEINQIVFFYKDGTFDTYKN
ncbi:helix-turn-helix transcriptional regulator [uncultured Aquimarina sp.]|uniref:helix-turn-helix domain-containing protein n=1 Tax=uncultured Aquimarina sp. TaxID=575652 RepID=UPI0026369497|nr:helix-turn-helix transcriptional regulator [uncultured Aquimarina sp.]